MIYRKTILISLAVMIPLIILSYLFVDIPVANYVMAHKDGRFYAFSIWYSEGATSTYILISAFILWLYLKYIKKDSYRALQTMFLFSSIVATGLAAQVLKFVFAKPRPGTFEEHGVFDFEFFMRDSNYNSFPSGHSTTAFTIFVVLTLLFPRYWLLFLVYAIGIIAARVGSFSHFVSDVMAGALLGIVLTLYIYEKWFYKSIENN